MLLQSKMQMLQWKLFFLTFDVNFSVSQYLSSITTLWSHFSPTMVIYSAISKRIVFIARKHIYIYNRLLNKCTVLVFFRLVNVDFNFNSCEVFWVWNFSAKCTISAQGTSCAYSSEDSWISRSSIHRSIILKVVSTLE